MLTQHHRVGTRTLHKTARLGYKHSLTPPKLLLTGPEAKLSRAPRSTCRSEATLLDTQES